MRGTAVALMVLGSLVASCDAAETPMAHSPVGEVAPSAGTSMPSPADRPRVVTLAFAGDVHFENYLADLLDHPRGALGPIADSLGAADLTMVNLESAITDRGVKDPKALEDPSRRFDFRAGASALAVLAHAGVDVVTVANNHGADYGRQGLADTLRAAERGPIAVVGVGRDVRDAFTPYRVSIHGTMIAVLGADDSPLESTAPTWSAGPHSPGLAAAHWPDQAALLSAVRAADQTSDVVVVFMHWGREYDTCPTDEQQHTAQALVRAGADVIVGSHAHVQQGAGWLGDTYVDYGLGNFSWYHDRQPDTGILRLRVVDGRVTAGHWSPARIQPDGPPVPLHGRAAEAAVERWRALRECAGLADSPGGQVAGFVASVHRIGPRLQQRMASTHSATCPVRWRDLRYLRIRYVGFDGADYTGELVVAPPYTQDVIGVFRQLFEARFPIRSMRLASDFNGDDDQSMSADNTSAFSCRRVAGTNRWSAHAYGMAIDINPLENPYLVDGAVRPPAGSRFAQLDRSPGAAAPAGVITSGDVVVRAFADAGWSWGGNWSSPDYQHFVASAAQRNVS